jgi:hypothetical protein
MRIRQANFSPYNYYYFTFGFGMCAINGQSLKKCFVKVKALTEEGARVIMYKYWGSVARYLAVSEKLESVIGMVQIRQDYNQLYLTK